MSINEIRKSNFSSEETNPIVIQLCEFGYDRIYSRRVFNYLHPEDLEEALNYMTIENGIIQHRFVHNRNNSNNICYICGEEQEIHLKELKMSINVNSENSLEESKRDQSKNYEANEKNKNNSNNNFLSCGSLIISFKKEKEKPKISDAINIKQDFESKKDQIECEVCNEMFIVNENNKVKKCGHSFCSNCWYDFLSVKIKENKLPSIKCLNYDCKEKLTDKFIINLLKSDIDLIKKYKRYQLELKIINDPNKKLCPYPNCDSYLELKQIRNKDVTCKNNHTFCFECLKKPHGKLPCNENLDKSMEEYAMNNFVKKCPKCSIITEKNNGCNHMTCTKCGYQWCWLCNQEYNVNHFIGGKCKGFQYFQPKNEYEIKLMMEGKINYGDLSMSQRQFYDNLSFDSIDDHQIPHFRGPNEEEIYNRISCGVKALRVLVFLIFGNCYFILKEFNIIDNRFFILMFMIYFLLSLSLFFQMIFLNIISLIFILIFLGFKKLILKFQNWEDLFLKKFVLILVNILFGVFCFCYSSWKELIYETNISNIFGLQFLIFFPCAIMSIIIYYPQRLLINIAFIIFTYIKERSFQNLLSDLDRNFKDAFKFDIDSDHSFLI